MSLFFRLSNLEGLEKVGLYINDLNMFDNSRDMVMAGWQYASQLECSIEQVCSYLVHLCDNFWLC